MLLGEAANAIHHERTVGHLSLEYQIERDYGRRHGWMKGEALGLFVFGENGVGGSCHALEMRKWDARNWFPTASEFKYSYLNKRSWSKIRLLFRFFATMTQSSKLRRRALCSSFDTHVAWPVTQRGRTTGSVLIPITYRVSACIRLASTAHIVVHVRANSVSPSNILIELFEWVLNVLRHNATVQYSAFSFFASIPSL
jgi:hypothetical protein